MLVCVFVVCAWARVRAYTRVCVRACMHACVYVCARVCMSVRVVYVCACKLVNVCACANACTCTCVCVHVCECASVPVCVCVPLANVKVYISAFELFYLTNKKIYNLHYKKTLIVMYSIKM